VTLPGHFVGVDVGGTKVAVATLDEGQLSDSVVMPTRKGSSQELVDQLADAVENARTDRTLAAGIGVPAAIEFATGTAKSGVNVPLHGVPLRNLLGERLGIPVFVDNDANVAALAEAHDGERLVTRHLVMLTVGTGVGGGLILDGRVYRGLTGAGAELGHILIGLDLQRGAPAPAARWRRWRRGPRSTTWATPPPARARTARWRARWPGAPTSPGWTWWRRRTRATRRRSGCCGWWGSGWGSGSPR